MIIKYDLSYRGLVHHRIRRGLDVLTPDFTLSHIAKSMPLRDDPIRKQLEDDLRAAGVRE